MMGFALASPNRVILGLVPRTHAFSSAVSNESRGFSARACPRAGKPDPWAEDDRGGKARRRWCLMAHATSELAMTVVSR